MRRVDRRGFTLLELIISLLLSMLVLIGVMSVAKQQIRNEYGGMKSGEVSAQTLAALDEMNRELENASYLYQPTASGNVISGCNNYSALQAQGQVIQTGCSAAPTGYGQLNCAQAVSSFYYCVAAGGGTEGNLDSLLRYPAWGTNTAASAECPYNNGTAPACTVADGTAHDVIINQNMSHYSVATQAWSATNYFNRDSGSGGLDMSFIVGFATAVVHGQATAAAGNVGLAQPVAYYINSKITMAKSYNNGD